MAVDNKVPLYKGGWFVRTNKEWKWNNVPLGSSKEEILKNKWKDTGNTPRDVTSLCINYMVY